MKLALGLVCTMGIGVAAADTTPQALPFAQTWSPISQIDVADMWTVPGIIGYRGDALVSAAGVDPQTIVKDGSLTPVQIFANQQTTTNTTGGFAEIELADPTVAFKGSSTADAPGLVITLNSTGVAGVRVQYALRDLDASTNDSIQPVALQYRVGTSGDYTNVPAGFVADATEPNVATKVTNVDVTLPANAGNVPVVQVRILTANANGNDEYVGIDNLSITAAPVALSGIGNAPSGKKGDTLLLQMTVTPATQPASTGLGVNCDIQPLGGLSTGLVDDGTNGDVTANDKIYSRNVTIVGPQAAGMKTLGCIIADTQGRTATANIVATVLPTCSDGVVEGGEACDDMNVQNGDGCTACVVDTGYDCAGTPSVCTDRDECATQMDNCADVGGTCTNTAGSFTCTCKAGFTGDGVTCTDIDECALLTDNCSDNATCTNNPGAFACACKAGFDGNGVTCTDVDECTTGADNCDANADCTNTPGSFTCACKPGFEGDGTSCLAACGDGVIDANETCDDGNRSNGDGCSGMCDLEPLFVCTGMPSECRPDKDSDGVPNADDNCPMDSNAAQGDMDNNGVGDACDMPSEDGGCCSTSSEPAGSWLLAFGTIGLLARRRRR